MTHLNNWKIQYNYFIGFFFFHELKFFLNTESERKELRLEKRLDGNYTRMLQAILNRSWRQHLTKPQLYGHLPHITKTIQTRRTRHAGHRWRSRDELISDVLLWTPTHGQAKTGRPTRTYILPKAMNDREGWRERVRDIFADGMTRWW